MQIHRREVGLGEEFLAPAQNVTFGLQTARGTFSIWYVDKEWMQLEAFVRYAVIGTGAETERPIARLVASVVASDGFHVWHLVQLASRGVF